MQCYKIPNFYVYHLAEKMMWVIQQKVFIFVH